MRVGLVEFAERNDIRTNRKHYTAADRLPTNRGNLNGEVANILVTSYDDATRMLRGSYKETAPDEFKHNNARA